MRNTNTFVISRTIYAMLCYSRSNITYRSHGIRLQWVNLILLRSLKNELSPRVITPFPNEFALAVGHFSRHADLVAVEVVHGMFDIIAFFITLRQRLIAVGMGVNVG